MGKYIRMTKPYLVAVTVFVLLRFVLELVGVNENGPRKSALHAFS